MLGLVGMNELIANNNFWQQKKRWVTISWIFFWVLNTIVMTLFMFSYSKKARVEAMYYFHDKKAGNTIVFDHSSNERSLYLPRFFMQRQWPEIIDVAPGRNIDELANELQQKTPENQPYYLLFLDDKLLKERVGQWKKHYPDMKEVFIAEPSSLDLIFYNLNKINANQAIYIYTLTKE
jgi:hypothetical protein